MRLPPELIKYILKIKHRKHVKEYMEAMLRFPKRILPPVGVYEIYYVYRLSVGSIYMSYAVHKEIPHEVFFEFSNLRRHREYLRSLDRRYHCKVHLYLCEFCERTMGNCRCESLFYCDCGHMIEYENYPMNLYTHPYLQTIYESYEEDVYPNLFTYHY